MENYIVYSQELRDQDVQETELVDSVEHNTVEEILGMERTAGSIAAH